METLKDIKSMIKVDLRRMFTMPLIYIMLLISLLIPILILVMTTMMAGTEQVNQVTGEVYIMEQMFTNTWEMIGALPNKEVIPGEINMLAMCNIDMMFFAVAIFVCIFIGEDFRSGYSKNIFTIRSKKVDYVVSKTVSGAIGGALIILTFVLGTIIGGAISKLSFSFEGFTIINLILSILSKMLITLIFVPIAVIASVASKDKMWLSIIISLASCMLFFMMVSMLSPLNSNIGNFLICLVGGLILSTSLGVISKVILSKTSLV